MKIRSPTYHQVIFVCNNHVCTLLCNYEFWSETMPNRKKAFRDFYCIPVFPFSEMIVRFTKKGRVDCDEKVELIGRLVE